MHLLAEVRVRVQGSPVEFVVDKGARKQVLLLVLQLTPFNIIPPMFPVNTFTVFRKDRGLISGRCSTETESHRVVIINKVQK
jgi:hypothetical protein